MASGTKFGVYDLWYRVCEMMSQICRLFWILLVLLLSSAHTRAEKTIVLTLAQNVAPAEQSAKILQEAYAQLGHTVRIVRAPRSRTLVLASTGQVDGDVAAGRAVEGKFPNLRRVDVPLVTIEVVVFVCKQTLDPEFRSTLAAQRIGRLSGAVVLESITQDFQDVWIGETIDELFEMLKRGRLDAVLGPRIALKKYEKEHEQGCLRSLDQPFTSVPLYHYLHETNSDLVHPLEDVLKAAAK